MKKGIKILVVGHNALRTGAPILLLNLMKILKEEGYVFNTLIRNKSNELAEEYKQLSDVFYFYPSRNKISLKKKIRNFLKGQRNGFDVETLLKGVDVILSNTITNGEAIEYLRKFYAGPIISYLHELEYSVPENQHTSKIFALSTYFIVPSLSGKNFIKEKFGVAEEKISILNSYIPSHNNISDSQKSTFREKNNITASTIVGAAGTLNWRKGSDLFVQVARDFFTKNPSADVQFVWAGAGENVENFKEVTYDIKKLHLADKIKLLPVSSDMDEFYKTINFFLLTSREENYPLVVLESACYKKPALCFSESGGATEFINNDAGVAVEYLDTSAMAEAVTEFYKRPELVNIMGEHAFNRVRSLHQDKLIIAEQFNQVIGKVLNMRKH